MTNQRPIKFRVYIEASEEDREVYGSFMNYYEPFNFEDGDFSMMTTGQDRENPKNSEVDLWDSGKYHIMQYTGLKDKNGVEIYEGDVVKNEDSDLISEIYFNDGTFWLSNKVFTRPLGELNHDIEVIGDLYENPELLVD